MHLWVQLSFLPVAFPQVGLGRSWHGTSMVLSRSLHGPSAGPATDAAWMLPGRRTALVRALGGPVMDAGGRVTQPAPAAASTPTCR